MSKGTGYPKPTGRITSRLRCTHPRDFRKHEWDRLRSQSCYHIARMRRDIVTSPPKQQTQGHSSLGVSHVQITSLPAFSSYLPSQGSYTITWMPLIFMYEGVGRKAVYPDLFSFLSSLHQIEPLIAPISVHGEKICTRMGHFHIQTWYSYTGVSPALCK